MSARAAVEVYELSTPTGAYVTVNGTANVLAQSTVTQSFADPVTGVTATGSSTTTALANAALGSFGVALGTTTTIAVCRENGQWIPKRLAFSIGPYTETASFQPYSRIAAGSFSVGSDGNVQVYNNIVDRMPSFVPDQLNARYFTRRLSFSLADIPTTGQAVATSVNYGGPALAVNIPSFRAFSSQNVTGAEFDGVGTITLTLRSVGVAEQIPAECLSANAKALTPAVSGGMPATPPSSGSSSGGGGAGGGSTSSGGGSSSGPGAGSSGGGSSTLPGAGSSGDGAGSGQVPATGGDSIGADNTAPSSGSASEQSSGDSGGGVFDGLLLAALSVVAMANRRRRPQPRYRPL